MVKIGGRDFKQAAVDLARSRAEQQAQGRRPVFRIGQFGTGSINEAGARLGVSKHEIQRASIALLKSDSKLRARRDAGITSRIEKQRPDLIQAQQLKKFVQLKRTPKESKQAFDFRTKQFQTSLIERQKIKRGASEKARAFIERQRQVGVDAKEIIKTQLNKTELSSEKKEKLLGEGIGSFQKLSSRIKEVEEAERRARLRARDVGVKQLIKGGKLPDAVIRTLEIGVEKFFGKISEPLRAKVFGSTPLSETDIKKISPVLAEVILFAGTQPILKTSGEIVTSLPKITQVKFVGSQKGKGGTIVTNVLFTVDDKIVGIAKGVSMGKGNRGVSITTGKFIKNNKKVKNVVEEILKGKKFASLEKDVVKAGVKKLTRKKLIKIKRTSRRKVLRQSNSIRRRRIIRQQFNKVKKEISEFKGVKRLKKIKEEIRFRKNSLSVRRRKLLTQLGGVKKELKEFKGVKLLKKTKEEIRFRSRSLGIRKKKLIKQLEKLKREFKGTKTLKKSKAEIKFRRGSINIRTKKIRKNLGKVKKELTEFKGVKRLKKIKEEIRFRKNSLSVRRRKLLTQLGGVKKELKEFKGVKLLKKTKEEIRFRSRSLGIRRRRLTQKLRGVTIEFKGVKRFRKVFPKKIKVTATKNLKRFTQVSKGRIGVGKKKFTLDEILSKADIFTRKDLSLIAGKTITKKKDLIEFIGLITSKEGEVIGGALSSSQKVVYKKALQEVIRTAGSLSKAKSIKGLSTTSKNAIAVTKAVPVKRGAIFGEPKLDQLAGTQNIADFAQRSGIVATSLEFNKLSLPVKNLVGLNFKQIKVQNEINKLNTKLNIQAREKQKPLTKQQRKQLTKQQSRLQVKQKQLQKQRQRLMTKQKQLQKQTQKQRARIKIVLPRTKKFKIFLPILKKKKKKLRVSKKKKPKQGYFTLARPLISAKTKALAKKRGKKAKRPKFIRVIKKTLRKSRAKDVGSYVTDTSLSRSYKIKKSKKKIQKTGIAPKGYFKKTKSKFRNFRIVKGRRVKLKNTFIEVRTKLLDRPEERKGIKLRKRISQLQRKAQLRNLKKARRVLTKQRKTSSRKRIITFRTKPMIIRSKPQKTTKRLPFRSTQRRVKQKVISQAKPKRKVSQKVLNNLARGRAKRLNNLKKRR